MRVSREIEGMHCVNHRALCGQGMCLRIVVEGKDKIGGGLMGVARREDEIGPGQEQPVRVKIQGVEFRDLVVIDEGDGVTQADALQGMTSRVYHLQGIRAQQVDLSCQVSMDLAHVQRHRGAGEGSLRGRRLGKVKGTRLDLHFQALIAAHQVERFDPCGARQKGGIQRLRQRLHARELGTRRQVRVIREVLIFGQWDRGSVRRTDDGAALLPIGGILLEELLERHMGRNL